MVKLCISQYPEENEEKYSEYFSLFPYELSDFQKYAIEAVVEGHHSLVCVPTGSGKTLPAIFTILHMHSKGKKVIYTGPIKSLLNQKFYDFTQNYPHISFGLMTGDIKLNPDADVILMTAEILANALFSLTADSATDIPSEDTNTTTVKTQLQFNIDIKHDLGAVIMDEVHYINDDSRGEVWEKTILMLPKHVQMVLLSATLDEPLDFAKWIETSQGYIDSEHSEKKEVYLSYNTIRHVPLAHYAYIATTESFLKTVKDKTLEMQLRKDTNKMIMIQNEKGEYLEHAYKTIKNTAEILEEREVIMKRKYVLNNLCEYMKINELLPAICFVFSRKNVETCACEITTNLLEDDSKIPYTMSRECEQILRSKLHNWREYAELPEYLMVVRLLEKGIGIHHSGMIPVLREIVELMITRGCIKLLFATESFAIGLDCPIRTAVFTALKKYDGSEHRFLYPHEYNQASGRAGRRGRDKIGYVIHCNNLFELPGAKEYKTILSGKPQKIISKFHISYSMILNLLKKGIKKQYDNFANKSMMYNEINKEYIAEQGALELMKTQVEELKNKLKWIRTSYDTCLKYIKLEHTSRTSVNKKKKEAERELTKLKEENKNINDDLKYVREYLNAETEYKNNYYKLFGSIDAGICSPSYNTSKYIRRQTYLVRNTLISCGFIRNNAPISQFEVAEQYEDELTEKGILASHIAEIHPLVVSDMIFKWNKLQEFNVFDIIGLLSCFTDVKVGDEYKIHEVNRIGCRDDYSEGASEHRNDICGKMLKKKLVEMTNIFEDYHSCELQNQIHTGFDYGNAYIYDMVEPMIWWAKECNDEYSCKAFFQHHTSVAGKISIGDFSKACVKVSTIAKELGSICEQMGFIELSHKLVQIDSKLLKYIATTQSLYV